MMSSCQYPCPICEKPLDQVQCLRHVLDDHFGAEDKLKVIPYLLAYVKQSKTPQKRPALSNDNELNQPTDYRHPRLLSFKIPLKQRLLNELCPHPNCLKLPNERQAIKHLFHCYELPEDGVSTFEEHILKYEPNEIQLEYEYSRTTNTGDFSCTTHPSPRPAELACKHPNCREHRYVAASQAELHIHYADAHGGTSTNNEHLWWLCSICNAKPPDALSYVDHFWDKHLRCLTCNGSITKIQNGRQNNGQNGPTYYVCAKTCPLRVRCPICKRIEATEPAVLNNHLLNCITWRDGDTNEPETWEIKLADIYKCFDEVNLEKVKQFRSNSRSMVMCQIVRLFYRNMFY